MNRQLRREMEQENKVPAITYVATLGLGLLICGASVLKSQNRVPSTYAIECQQTKAAEHCRVVKGDFVHYFSNPKTP